MMKYIVNGISIKWKGDGYYMRIGKLITAALGVASIANEAHSLGHQN